MRKLPVAIATAMKKAGVKPKSSKYRAVPTVVDGIRFDSKAEAEYYRRLKLHNIQFIRQPSFDLPGGVKYRADFFRFSTYGSDPIEVIDVKGKDTAISKLKRKQVEELYGIKIHVMKAVYRRGVIVSFEEVET